MATNGETPAADVEMAECDGEKVVTMMDVLKEQQDFEDDANAVLGGSDEKECTFSQGYIKRQAIYACVTCCPESKDDPLKRAGFCLACSLTCHENHDLVELYTKRNFRCDCGNPKFKTPCQFTPNKTELNDENVYNQNFIGLYCICSKPYGDQESTLDDEMIQCVVCEDWWHATHLDAVIPAPDLYAEMICKLCMAKNEFLHDYSALAVNEAGDVDVVKVNGDDGTEAADKLANGSLTDDFTIRAATDVKLTNGIEDTSTSDDKETDTTDVTKEVIPGSNEDNSITVEESKEPEKLENVVIDSEKSVDSKSEAASPDSDETDKAPEVVPEISMEENKPSEESITSIPKAEESSVTSEDKTGDGDKTEDDSATAADKTTDVHEENNDNAESVTENVVESEPSEQNNEASSQSQANTEKEKVTEVTENLTEAMDSIENKVTDDQEEKNNAEKMEVDKNPSPDAETDKPSAETDKPSAETDKPSAETDKPSAEIDKPSAETDKPSAETNEKSTDLEADETSLDEKFKDISQEIEDKLVSKGNPDEDTSKIDEAGNGDPKENDSTNKNESESNENKVPELASTENKRKMSTEDVPHDISVKKPKLDDSQCLRPKGIKKVYNGATFWPATFRQKLCKCNECTTMYKDLSVLFLIDMEDTVFAYETLGKERTAGKPNQYEKGIEALCSLGRIQQIDALTEYNKMRDKLLTFLQSFKEKKEIVTEHDIKTFFAGMKPEKRTDGVYFCR